MTDQQLPTSESNSFVTGFTIGLFAGAAGYFLFATEKGAKLRKQLADEWEVAKSQLAADGVIADSQLSFRDFIRDVFQKTVNVAETETSMIFNAINKNAKDDKATPAKKKVSSTKRFKGV